jgi:Fe-S oxidoreductase
VRIKEALETKARVIATACPYCIRMLDRAVRALGVEKRIAVQDVAQLLLHAAQVGVEADRFMFAQPDAGQEVCHG